ncbi:MAG: hypothetical protein ACO331_07480, partial [Prochlorothrix sp.]
MFSVAVTPGGWPIMLLEAGIAEVIGLAGAALLRGVGGAIGKGCLEMLREPQWGRDALVQDQAKATELAMNPELLRQFMEKHDGLIALQAEQNALKQEELTLAAKSGALSLAMTQRLGEAQLDLGWRTLEQQGQIETAKLQQQRQLAEEARALQIWLQGQSLQVQQRQHQESLDFQRQAQQIQIEADWQLNSLATILSAETLRTLPIDRLQFVAALMKVSDDCPDYFRHTLGGMAKSEMRIFQRQLRGKKLDFYPQFFKSEDVFDTDIEQLRRIIPNHRVIAGFSAVLQGRAYFHYTLWGSEMARSLDYHFDQGVNWGDWMVLLRREATQQGQELPEGQLQELVGRGLVALQKLFACYLADLYALVDGADPYVTLTIDQVFDQPVEPLLWPYRFGLEEELRQLQGA